MAPKYWLCKAGRIQNHFMPYLLSGNGHVFKDVMPVNLIEGRMPESRLE